MFVFISHTHAPEDLAAAKKIANGCKARGIEFFLDAFDIEWGGEIDEDVESALARSTHIIVLLSPASAKSQWVSYEAGFARASGAILLPYKVHSAMDVPSFFGLRKWVTESNLEEGLDRLEEPQPSLESDPRVDPAVPKDQGHEMADQLTQPEVRESRFQLSEGARTPNWRIATIESEKHDQELVEQLLQAGAARRRVIANEILGGGGRAVGVVPEVVIRTFLTAIELGQSAPVSKEWKGLRGALIQLRKALEHMHAYENTGEGDSEWCALYLDGAEGWPD